MKKSIVTLFCFSFLLSLNAQTTLEPIEERKSLGLRSGYEFQANNSNLNYNLNLPYLGPFYEVKLKETWSLQFEINMRSEKRERSFKNGFTESVNELYLTGPILMNFILTMKSDYMPELKYCQHLL